MISVRVLYLHRTRQLSVTTVVSILTQKRQLPDLQRTASITISKRPSLKEYLCMVASNRVALLGQTSCRKACQKLFERVATKSAISFRQPKAMSLLIAKSLMKSSRDTTSLLVVRKD